MRKFYQSVEVVQGEGGYAVRLDGTPVKTPAKQPLILASEKLAEAVAEEWRAQAESIHPDTMPITRIVTIAIDRVPHDRALLIEDILRYAETDLLCYRAPSQRERGRAAPAARGEGDLRALQDLHFTLILTWAAGQGIRLEVTDGIAPIPQADASLMRVREMVAAAEDIELAALAMATPLLGSAILALALWQRQIDVEEAICAARLDEAHQAAQWGEDAEANAQWGKRARDIRGAAAVFSLAAV